MRSFRLVKEKYRHAVLAGKGASFLHGARYNMPGQQAVYTSENRALAILESLAHIPQIAGLPPHVMCEIEIPDSLIEIPAKPPDARNASAARDFGSQWFEERRTAAIALPSVISPHERNIVLNAAHPEFGQIKVLAIDPYPLDERLAGLFGGD